MDPAIDEDREKLAFVLEEQGKQKESFALFSSPQKVTTHRLLPARFRSLRRMILSTA